MSDNYYPPVVLKECKCFCKKKEVTRHIIEDLEISSDEKSVDEKKFTRKLLLNNLSIMIMSFLRGKF